MSTWLPSTRGAAVNDYTRVCDACGTAWRLPHEAATEKAQRATSFAIGRRRKLYTMQASTLQSSQSRVLTNAQCPSCGASAFKQSKPGDVVTQDVVTTPRTTQQGTSSSTTDKLAKLVQLRDSGALTDDEFAAEIDLL